MDKKKKIKFFVVGMMSSLALSTAVVVLSQNQILKSLPASAIDEKSFTFDSSVGSTYFSSDRDREKTISTNYSSDIKAGVHIKGKYSSDISFGGSNFLEKQSYALDTNYNFLVGVNNIVSFSLRFRMVNYSSVIDPSEINYNSYVYFYDENYSISTALSNLSSGNDNYVDPIYSSENIGGTGVEKNTYYTVSWSKPNEATYVARHMRLYFSISGNKDTYANLQFESLTVNWKC